MPKPKNMPKPMSTQVKESLEQIKAKPSMNSLTSITPLVELPGQHHVSSNAAGSETPRKFSDTVTQKFQTLFGKSCQGQNANTMRKYQDISFDPKSPESLGSFSTTCSTHEPSSERRTSSNSSVPEGSSNQRPQSRGALHSAEGSGAASASPATSRDDSSEHHLVQPAVGSGAAPAPPAAKSEGSSNQRPQSVRTITGSGAPPAQPATNSDSSSEQSPKSFHAANGSCLAAAPHPIPALTQASTPAPIAAPASLQASTPAPSSILDVRNSLLEAGKLQSLEQRPESLHTADGSCLAAAPPPTPALNPPPPPAPTPAPAPPPLSPPIAPRAPVSPQASAPAQGSIPDVWNQLMMQAERLEEFNLCYQKNSSNLRGIDLFNFLKTVGFKADDPRLVQHMNMLQGGQHLNDEEARRVLGNVLIRKALRKELAIKDFPNFVESVKELYHAVKKNTAGHVATYIPQLANQRPNLWGVSVCSVDGQRFSVGDSSVPFCIQSTSKPITYCLAVEINGEQKVHRHVGREPSGRNFNDRCLMQQGDGKNSIPHNPYINAGAIMTASLVKMDATEWDRFTYMMGIWQKLCGGVKPSFQNDTFMGERATASRNFCLAYMMEEENSFPMNTDLQKTLDAYFTWCSIEITCESMAMVAATLANGGICPTTNERIFTYETVTNCLSLMMSCGMYDFSGQFAFQIGFPAKSGVSGVMCVVIPGVCGLATFSPRLDSSGNSVRGIDFCQRLANRFPYHVFCQESKKERKNEEKEDKGNASLWWSAASGDEQRVRQLAACGIDVSIQDYDQRSALHLAASEGHNGMIRRLLALQADVNARDHLGNTPIDDAIREHKNNAKTTLHLATRSKHVQDAGLAQNNMNDLFRYFATETCRDRDDVLSVARTELIEVLDHCGLDYYSDPRLKFLERFPDPFTAEDLSSAGARVALLTDALRGKLVVPNFTHLCDRFEEMFATMIAQIQENSGGQNACVDETLNVMTVDGQRLHLGRTDQFLCAGDLISLAIFAVAIEKVGQDVVMEFVGSEPSGLKSDAVILNADNVPYNPLMWTGMLSLIAVLEEKCGDAERVVQTTWARLCNHNPRQDGPMRCDEDWMQADQQEHTNRVMVSIYSMLDEGKFPDSTAPERLMEIFFRLRATKTNTQGLGSIGAVFANCGRHPVMGQQIFQPETVKCILSMMYAAGCNAQSGEFSFKVGIPAKSSSEGAILLVLPNVMGMCILSPEINHNDVSIGALNFCTAFAKEFNCHVLAGDSKSSGKGDMTMYHFQTDMELCEQLLFAAESGDMITLSALHQLGFSLDYSDYDYRSAAHVAACSNQIKVLKYLNKKGVTMHPKDRWGSTPYDDAMRSGHHKAACLLKSFEDPDDMEGGSQLGGMSCIGSCVSGHSGHRTHKSKRATAPVAAMMGSMTFAEENDEEDAESE